MSRFYIELKGPKTKLKIMKGVSRLKLVAIRANYYLLRGSSFRSRSIYSINKDRRL